RLPPDREETPRDVNPDDAVTGQGERPRVPPVAAADIEDEVARRNVGDEVDHLGPRLDLRLGVGLRDPVIRRPNVCLGPAHSGDETLPAHKVSVRARGTRGESPRPPSRTRRSVRPCGRGGRAPSGPPARSKESCRGGRPAYRVALR